jgi:hypothetical protein
MLLNLVEELKSENRELREQVKRLQDEIHRLKGEQGRPDIKPNKPKGEGGERSEHSSEKERKKPGEWHKTSKLERIQIDREEVLKVEQEGLPTDAEFKGYEEVVVQDLSIKTDNVRFKKEKYYSATLNKTYLAEVPRGYEGGFGSGVKSMVITLYYGGNMTEPKIVEWLREVGIQISFGQISNMLIKGHEGFHAEKEAVYEAGLRSSPWQHLDDTATRVSGSNQHCQVVCNPLYTAYFTTEKKDRMTVLDVLRNFRERGYRVNGETIDYLQIWGVSARIVEKLGGFEQDREYREEEFEFFLREQVEGLGPQQRRRVMEAAAVSAYHAEVEFPVVKLLVCDDAPQFKWLTEELGLCWVHDGRHYKKLIPYIAYHREELERFRGKYWTYYDRLVAYRNNPTLEEKIRLSQEFDELFSTVTGYQALDERIAKTRSKRDELLRVLEHPEIELHNNPAELGARLRVRKRDISFGTRSEAGTKGWDTFMTLAATAKKLGVSFYKYIRDRIGGTSQVPNLAALIDERAKALNLGASWNTS